MDGPALYDFVMADLQKIRADLSAELEELDRVVSQLDEAGWNTPTPAEGWSIRDQISHLAFFDEQAEKAARDPDAFNESLQQIAADAEGFVSKSVGGGRSMTGDGILEWWRVARTKMLVAFQWLLPDQRIPWFGPPMSPASFMSARLMEAWAHGQDIVDALDVPRQTHPRLKHVAHLCVLSRRNGYIARGMTPSEEPVYVELQGAEGETWVWGEPTSGNSIKGGAYEFCLVVTQRRHPDDTYLTIEGDAAREWMSVAQAFAGPPGSGRAPGQFPKRLA